MKKFKKSSSSCHVNEIKGIIFGGISSRFWMLRKHINSLIDVKQLKNFPFFAWNCITLQLRDREVDLIIKNEESMKNFLTYLVYKIKTVDGNRGSAISVIEALSI